jgi:hypothetical protein
MGLTRRYKTLAVAAVALVAISVLALMVLLPERKPDYGHIILEIGRRDRVFFNGRNVYLCSNGAMFEHANISTGTRDYYMGRLNSADLAELKSKLGSSFTLSRGPQVSYIFPKDVDVDGVTGPFYSATYVGGGGAFRQITEKQASDFMDLVWGYMNRATPAPGSERDRETGETGLKVKYVDCVAR